MQPATEKLWALQKRHDGGRVRLFEAVKRQVGECTVLYPGSFVDLTASFVFRAVTYVDSDRRAPSFFEDEAGIDEILATNGVAGRDREIEFIGADYRSDLPIADASFDLLVSMYAGFVSEACTRYLRLGGHLLVNPSHGDAAMASIDERYRLVGVVHSGGARGYRIETRKLDTYLLPKKPQAVTVDRLHELGRGIGYTRSAFAYLFERIR